MTKDDIIRMAREASDPDKVDPFHNGFWVLTQEELERFAALVAAAEREECAKVCEAYENDMGYGQPQKCADAIRARGDSEAA